MLGHEWLVLPIIILGMGMVWFAVEILAGAKVSHSLYRSEDLILWVGLIVLVLSAFVNPNNKSLNYIAAYLVIFGCGYTLLKGLLSLNGLPGILLRVNAIAVLSVSAFCIVAMIAYWFYGADLQNAVPRVKPAQATYLGIPRAYGLSTEPGVLAYYYDTMGMLAVGYIYNHVVTGWRRWAALSLILMAWIITFSAAAFIILPISAIIVAFLVSRAMPAGRDGDFMPTAIPAQRTPRSNQRRHATVLLLIGLAVLSAITIATSENIRTSVTAAADPLIRKITLTNIGSAEQRQARWESSLQDVVDAPILGKGIGYYSAHDQTSSINWYLFIAAEAGLVSLFLFVCFFGSVFLRILNSNVPLRSWYLIGFLSGSAHLLAISTIHHAFLWTLIAMFYVISTEHNNAVNGVAYG